MQTEPEQWAVTEADIEGTPDWAFSLASTIVLGNYGCGHAAVLIQRAFEDRERKLREENQRLMIAAAATIQGGMDEYKRGNADGVKAGIESGLEQAARIARAAQYSKSPATDTLRGIGDLLARQALKETPDAQ